MTYVDFDGITVIESLEPHETQTGTQLHQHLQQHPNAGSVTLSHHRVSSTAGFFTVLDGIRLAATSSEVAPILHLEIHGRKQGLDLNNGETVSWEDFADRCRDINIALKNHLVITLAVCKGAYAERGANPRFRAPYFGIIASFDTEYAPSLASGFQAFYDELLTSQDFNIAHADLQRHLPRFRLLDSTGLFLRTYATYRKNGLTPDALQERVSDIATFVGNLLPEQFVKDYARRELLDDSKRQEELWRNFVMADLDEANEKRCPLPPENT